MKFFLWILLFVAALVLEISILPKFFGARVPVVSFAVVLIGMLFQVFWYGLLYAGATGIIRDFLAPPANVSHTVFFILLFLLLWLFITFSGWDEPARRVGAITLVFLLMPILWNMSSLLVNRLFHSSSSYISFGDVFSAWFFMGSFLAFLFVSVFSWGLVRRSRRHMVTVGSRL